MLPLRTLEMSLRTALYSRCNPFDHVPAFSLVRRWVHHSSTQGRFYTNRFYIKQCSNCNAVNSLTLVSCVNCCKQLTDQDIRLRRIDHICQVSNARKHEPKLTGGGGVEVPDLDAMVLYRCFDFTVMANRSPAALLHVSAFPNGTFYDIKNFRRAHITLIERMAERCRLVFKEALEGRVSIPGVDEAALGSVRAIMGQRESAKTVWDSLIFGFNYPNAHCHVDMHAIMPPVLSLNVFRAPFYFTLEKVLSDLRNFGRVRQYSPAQMRVMNENDEVLEAVRAKDSRVKSLIAQLGPTEA